MAECSELIRSHLRADTETQEGSSDGLEKDRAERHSTSKLRVTCPIQIIFRHVSATARPSPTVMAVQGKTCQSVLMAAPSLVMPDRPVEDWGRHSQCRGK